jgi:hypothetical protein
VLERLYPLRRRTSKFGLGRLISSTNYVKSIFNPVTIVNVVCVNKTGNGAKTAK